MKQQDPAKLSLEEKRAKLRLLLARQQKGLPLSYGQQRLWFLYALEGPSATYNVRAGLNLSGMLDVEQLQQAVAQTVARHGTLRTSFLEEKAETRALIAENALCPLRCVDLSGLHNYDTTAALDALLFREAQYPFRLEQGPLLRTTLFRLSEQEHVLALVMHHIISDGPSLFICIEELVHHYHQSGGRRNMPLPALGSRYDHFVTWQNQRLKDREDKQLDFWRKHLEGAPAQLELPLDKARPALMSYRGARVFLQVPAPLVAALEQNSRRYRVTPFALWLATYQVLLHRISGQDDVVVGTPITNRSTEEQRRLIGFLVNTLCPRLRCPSGACFEDLAKQAGKTMAAALTHRDIPFERLVERLKPRREMSVPVLFQAMFIYQRAPALPRPLPLLATTFRDLHIPVTRFDLTMVLSRNDAGISGWLEYNTDILEAETVQVFTDCYLALLAEIAAEPTRPVAGLPMLTQAKQQALCRWAQAERPLAFQTNLARLLDDQARRTPHAVALTFAEQSWSYQQLNQRARRLAFKLKRLGVVRDQPVAICLDRSAELVCALLAVTYAGAAYLPLDPQYPEARLAYMLADSRTPLVIIGGEHPTFIPENLATLRLSPGEGETGELAEALPAISPEHSAYLIYTSGSTGRPKGVMVPHQAICNRLLWMQATFPLGTDDVVLQKTPFSFDVSVWEFFWPLLSGAQLAVAEPGIHTDPEALAAAIARRCVTTIHFVPSMLAAFLSRSGAGNLDSLRRVFCSGEALTAEHVTSFFKVQHSGELHNLYGPTEAAVDATWFACTPRRQGTPPIGRAIANTGAFILDHNGQLMPAGLIGELHLSGVGLARGYLNRPGLTAERFVPNPVAQHKGARCYRTGDRARLGPDGNLMFLGRLDHQVKLRGFRIELGEIELTLAAHPSVSAAAVTVHDGGLTAHLVLQGVPDLDAVRAYARQQLPDHMVPAFFNILERLPVTSGGKLDRKLLAGFRGGALQKAAGKAPRTPREALLVDLWRDVLKLEQTPGIDEDFFDLGGYSLMAGKVLARIAHETGVTLSVRDFFQNPTPAGLAERLTAKDGANALPDPQTLDRPTRLPLSFSQQRLWFLDRLEGAGVAYNTSGAQHLRGPLNQQAFTQALLDLGRRHESLRTRFVEIEELPSQVVVPMVDPPLHLENLTLLDEPSRQRRIQAVIKAEAAHHFDLSRAPLWRVVLLALAPDEHILILSMHHIISDGWSMGILLRELAGFYGAHSGGPAYEPEPLPLQYGDFAHWQRTVLAPTLDAQIEWWRTHLSGAPPFLDIPTDFPRPAVQSYGGARVQRTLGESHYKGLHRLCRATSTTPFMAVLGLFATQLARYSNQDEVVVGTPIANRDRRVVEGLIGFFANTLALRTDLAGAPSFRGLLSQIRTVSLEAYDRQHVPFEQLVEVLRPRRDMARSPIFQAMLVYQNTAEETPQGGLSMVPVPFEEPAALFDLTLMVEETAGTMSWSLGYNRDLFERSSMAHFLENLEYLLEQVIAFPDHRLNLLSSLAPGQKRELLARFGEAVTFPAELDLYSAFAMQARRTPDAQALLWEEEGAQYEINYETLYRRANHLAHALRESGVGPGSVVALHGTRDARAVLAMLATLAAGAAWLPLAPDQPQAVLRHMLSESACRMVLGWTDPIDGDYPNRYIAALHHDGPERAEPPKPRYDPEDLAYLIYTSGSTGLPKGVLLRQRGAMNTLTSFIRDYRTGPGDRQLQQASLSFDVSVGEIFPMLLSGGAVVFAPDDLSLEPAHFQTFLQTRGITIFGATPSLLANLNQISRLPASVRLILSGGEALAAEQIDNLVKATTVSNGYGPTETTICASYALCRPGASPHLGRTIANMEALVMDRWGRLQPRGVAGELWLTGEGLAQGYLNDPVKTALSFVPLPENPRRSPINRAYRTGDLVRLDGRGELQFLGRIDFQIKLRGYRIELGSIEAALRRQPSVEAAHVLLLGQAPNQRLTAYLQGGELSEIRAGLRGTLPEYAIPSAFVQLVEMPLTRHGKIDREALANIEAPESSDLTEARTPLEHQLVSIWCDLLKRQTIGIHENFFDLGGHSLLATQLVSRIRVSLGLELPVRTIFEASTVAQLAAAVEVRETGRNLPDIEKTPREPFSASEPLPSAPLSFAQRRLWFVHQLEGAQAPYIMAMPLRLNGNFCSRSLERAFEAVISRHENLRTVFRLRGEAPRQVILPPQPFSLAYVDLSIRCDGLKHARSLARRFGGLSFDLGEGPLLRAALLRLGDQGHVLLLSMHHIISDAWSMGVFVKEIATYYHGFSRAQAVYLPELPLQYADVAVWQQQAEVTRRLEVQTQWWREQLADASYFLDLPNDLPRGRTVTYNGAAVGFECSPEQTRQLKEVSREAGCTLYMTLLAVYALLLQRWSNNDDLLIGTPIANRNRGELEGLIGFFVNTLVLRVKPGRAASFDALLELLRVTTLDAFAHADIPFERLVETLQPDRHLTRSPLFQVMFILQNAPVETSSEKALAFEGFETEAAAPAQFELTLVVREVADRLHFKLNYNRDLFSAGLMARMRLHLQNLLERLLRDRTRPLSQISMLGEAEERQLLLSWNNPKAVFPAQTLDGLFRLQAKKTPERTATIMPDGTRISFAQLDRYSESWAAVLAGRGIGPDVPVGILMHRTCHLMVALLAVLKAGGTYVPLDPEQPPERLALMVAETRVPLVLAEGRAPEWLGATPHLVLSGPPPEPGNTRLRPAESRNLAYILFTSGSTGTPKGVAATHGATINRLRWMWVSFPYGEQAFSCARSTLNFVDSVWELFGPLLQGVPNLLIPRTLAADPERFIHVLAQYKVTRIVLVPALLRLMLDNEPQTATRLPHLRFWTCSGEVLVSELAKRFKEQLPDRTLLNLYGSSEVAADATYHVVSAPPGRSVPIGRPIDGVRTYILDRYHQTSPIGVSGHLHIGGLAPARCYLNNPALTAERFIPDPHGDGWRLFKTGDRALYRSDGNIELLGRMDRQVKLRGIRIEPGEIETCLSSLTGVDGAHVRLREDLPNHPMLVAYVTGSLGPDWRKELAQKLPEYMIPSAVVNLDAFPLNPSGKLDVFALPAPERGGGPRRVAPRTPVEQAILELFGEILNHSEFGIRHNFFELGGHSLLATRVVNGIRRVLNVDISLRTFFANPTVEALAEAVEASQGHVLEGPTPISREKNAPLSFAQSRLWFIQQLEQGGSAYNISVALELRGPLDRDALQQALDQLALRHESLRTCFPDVDGEPYQHIAPPARVPIHTQNLSALSPARRDGEVRARQEHESRFAYDLAGGPLWRVVLLAMAPNHHALIVSMHHIISDGWSLGVVVRELAALYRHYHDGLPNPLRELPVQYPDFAWWQHRVLGPLLPAQIQWWRQQLDGAPGYLELPTDKPRPAVQTYNGAVFPLSLDEATTTELHHLAHDHKTTLFMVLMGAFATLLWRYSGQRDLVIGSPIANRNRRELEDLIGFFVNTLPLRCRLNPRESFTQLLAHTKRQTLAAYDHQDVPFEKLVASLTPERDMSRSPLFQTMLVLQNAPLNKLEGRDLRFTPLPSRMETALYDLTLMAAEVDEKLSLTLGYNTDLFEARTIERIALHFAQILRNICRTPAQALTRLSTLDDPSRQELLHWMHGPQVALAPLCLHQLVERQAQRSPHATALQDCRLRLSYRQLDRFAQTLALRLRAHGVKREDVVAIHYRADVYAAVAMLATLKAGAAWLPLDPAQPRERLGLMLRGVSAVFCDPRTTLPGKVPCLDPVTREEGAAPALPSDPDQVAYLIYTSGSSGVPKGVQLSHRGVVNTVTSFMETYQTGPGDRQLQQASLAFDVSVAEIFPMLCSGGCVDFAPPALALDPQAFMTFIADRRITIFGATPSLLANFNQPGALPSSVRLILSGGEALTLSHVNFLLDAVTVTNGYGPTETSICATVFTCDTQTERPPIGRALQNMTALVVDPDGYVTPLGVPGELWLAGPGLARSYWGDPGRTAAQFVPLPLEGAEEGSRAYRTGDLVRYDNRGRLHFLGRIDAQVKLRGYRIELGAVETALSAVSGIEQTAVLLHQGPPQQLVAYYTGKDIPVAQLREQLGHTLPAYMVPAGYLYLEEMPRTDNDKINRKALAQLPLLQGEPANYTAPVSEHERKLAEIWAELLNRERVGIHDNFFELGGHSLLATRLVAQIRRELGWDIPLRGLFEAPTIAGLLQLNRDVGLPPILPRSSENTQPIPLSYAQQRLWFLDRFTGPNATYHIPISLHFQGPFDTRAACLALEQIGDRHQSLRTTFEQRGEEVVQVIHPADRLQVQVVDLRGLGRHAVPPARLLVAELAVRPFDLAGDLPVRMRLYLLAEQETVLQVVQHHIASDGWSTDILSAEFAYYYERATQGQSTHPTPPDLPIQYADYALWQHSEAMTRVLDTQNTWWVRQLAEAPALLEMPTDHPRPPQASGRGAVVPIPISPKTGSALSKLCDRFGVTPFMALQAALAALLARYSGQSDILLGTPVANRRQTELSGLIGFFVNTLVLRNDLSGAPTFEQLLAKTRVLLLDALSHQDVPFERVVERVSPQRTGDHTPLFQVLFSWNPTPPTPRLIAGTRLSGFAEGAVPARFELTFNMEGVGDQLQGHLVYSTDLYGKPSMTRLAVRFARLLEQLSETPQAAIHLASLNTPEEQAELLRSLQGGQGFSEQTLHDRTAGQGAHRARKIAVESHVGGTIQRMDHHTLHRRALGLAHHLRRQGLRPGEPVVLSMRHPGLRVIANLAILHAGGAFVPLDPDLPEQRRRWIMDDTGARLLIAESPLDEYRGTWIDGAAAHESETPLQRVDPAMPAYLIYTSGSTGKPKGVVVSHGAVIGVIEHGIIAQRITGGTRGLSCLNPAFDFAVYELFTLLIGGGTVVFSDPEQQGEPEHFCSLINQHSIQVLQCTPSFLREMLREPVTGLHTIHLGGEALTRPLIEAVFAKVPANCRLFNGYGPTEAGINTTLADLGTSATRQATPLVPIGIPAGEHGLYVLDSWGIPVPDDLPGELYIEGHLANGYLNRPALTAARFVPNPFGRNQGARLYRSGDRVRSQSGPDGLRQLVFLGRMDQQVKLRGYRIELGEIEAVLAGLPGVEGAVVQLVGEGVEAYLSAFVAANPETVSFPELKNQLPAYMVPGRISVVNRFPLTSNGKIDRVALLAQDHSSPSREREEPRTPREALMLEIWQDLLERTLGVNDNFFDMGGHSLLATRLVSRLRDRFGVELPVRAVFEAPTPAALSEALTEAEGTITPPIEPTPRRLLPAHVLFPPQPSKALVATAPLSHAQRRLWFLDQLEGGKAPYNMPNALRLRGPICLRSLKTALGQLCARHESLRTHFAQYRQEPLQVVAGRINPTFQLIDLTAFPDRAAPLVTREAVRTFDLSAGPLLRTCLLRLGPDEHVLLITLHHIISDGWSMGLFVDELIGLYHRALHGSAVALSQPALQYADVAVWQRDPRVQAAQRGWLDWWSRYLAEAPMVLDLPIDFPRPAVLTHQGGTHGFFLPESQAAPLLQLGKAQGATPFMTLLTVFGAYLARLCGSEDVLIGSPIANRNRAELEGIIGFFVNTLVLRCDLRGGPSFKELLQRVRRGTLEAYAHQDVPFERLVEHLQPERDMSRSPIFQVMLSMQNNPKPTNRVQIPTIRPLENTGGQAAALFELSLSVTEVEDGLLLGFGYNRDLFRGETIARFAQHLQQLCALIVQQPERPVGGLDFRTNEETRLLESLNATHTALPQHPLLHRLFEQQAAKQPNAVALIEGEQTISYAELNAAANHLVLRLMGQGVDREMVVGLHCAPGIEAVCAMFAVLKAGAAWCPLGLTDPAEKKAHIIREAGIALVIGREPLGDFDGIMLSPQITGGNEPNPEREIDPYQSAYIIYTSGSSGRPKGVLLHHRGAVNLVQSFIRDYRTGRGDRQLQQASLTFDVSIGEIFPMLSCGGAVVFGDREALLEPAGFKAQIARYGITIFGATPSLLATFNREGAVPESVRLILSGGEALNLSDVDRLLASTTVTNGYGPTETTVCATYSFCSPEDPKPSIGKPLQNTRVHVRDRRGYPCPLGTAGELWLAGVGLARGYLQDPAKTAAAFVPLDNGERAYRTGDLVRLDRGNLHYLGRIDHQIKLRGYRIELGDIEHALMRFPGLGEAACQLTDKLPGGKQLLAHYTSRAPLEPTQLRRFLAERLPAYMIPSHLMRLEHMPLTTNGKLDRSGLPLPELSESARYVPPRNALEAAVAESWRETLGLPQVGAFDNFFDLGGHSLLATRAMSLLEAKLARPLAVRNLFATPVLAELAKQLEEAPEPPQDLFKAAAKAGIELEIQQWDSEIGPRVVWVSEAPEPAIALLASAAPEAQLPRYLVTRGSKKPGPLVLNLRDPREDQAQLHRQALTAIETTAVHLERGRLSAPISATYQSGPHVTRYLSRPKRTILGCRFHGRRGLVGDRLREGLQALLEQQGLLRADVVEEAGKWVFRERACLSLPELPVLDLSPYQPGSHGMMVEMLAGLLAQHCRRGNGLEQLLFSLLVVKLDLSRYQVLFALDHAIADNGTGRVLKTFLEPLNRPDFRGFPEQIIPSYAGFAAHLEPARGSDDPRLLALKAAPAYRAFRDRVTRLNARLQLPTPHVFGPPRHLEIHLQHVPAEAMQGHALAVIATIMGGLYQLEEVPLRVLISRRYLEGVNYFQTIGDFHDHVPVLLAPGVAGEVGTRALQAAEAAFVSFPISAMMVDEEVRRGVYACPFNLNFFGAVDEEGARKLAQAAGVIPFVTVSTDAYFTGDKLGLIFNHGLPTEAEAILADMLKPLGPYRLSAPKPLPKEDP